MPQTISPITNAPNSLCISSIKMHRQDAFNGSKIHQLLLLQFIVCVFSYITNVIFYKLAAISIQKRRPITEITTSHIRRFSVISGASAAFMLNYYKKFSLIEKAKVVTLLCIQKACIFSERTSNASFQSSLMHLFPHVHCMQMKLTVHSPIKLHLQQFPTGKTSCCDNKKATLN